MMSLVAQMAPKIFSKEREEKRNDVQSEDIVHLN